MFLHLIDEVEYQVTCSRRCFIRWMGTIFKDIIKESKDYAISEDEIIVTVQSFDEVEIITTNGIKVFNTLYPSDIYIHLILYILMEM